MKTKVKVVSYIDSNKMHGRSNNSRPKPEAGAKGYIDGYGATIYDMFANVVIDGKIYAIDITELEVITDGGDN